MWLNSNMFTQNKLSLCYIFMYEYIVYYCILDIVEYAIFKLFYTDYKKCN